MGEIIWMGDTHFREEEPFASVQLVFLSWLEAQSWNNPDNVLIHLGDLTHRPLVPGSVYRNIFEMFFSTCRFKEIYVLEGSHTYSRQKRSSVLSSLDTFKNIHAIQTSECWDIEGTRILFLPYYYTGTNGLPSMKEYYANLPKILTEGVSFISGHYNDETQTLFHDYIDTSYLKGKRISGHVHTRSENYLGTPYVTRFDEKGKDSFMYRFNPDTGEEEYIPVPKCFDYRDIMYGDIIPEEPDRVYPVLYDVYDAPSVEFAYSMYGESNIHKVYRVQEKTEATNMTGERKTYSDFMNDFLSDKKYSQRTKNRLIQLVEGV